jgi:hypothetical protein
MDRRVADLNSAELLELVRQGNLEGPRVLEVLRNKFCTTEIAQLVADSPRWMTSHRVRELVAGFRGFPFARAMNVLATLPWTSLLQLAQEPRTAPVVRRQAERKIIEHLSRMTLGEKVALARLAHRPIFRSLVASGDEMVLTALLDNPRMVENDVLYILNTTEPRAEFYATVVKHHKWGPYYRVRRALAECANTPLPLALSALVQLKASDIRDMATRPNVPERIREAAQALVDKQREGGRRVLNSDRDGRRVSTDAT